MNQAIEDYLAGLFTSAQIVPAPEVFTGTSSDIRTPESHAILVLADSIENVVGQMADRQGNLPSMLLSAISWASVRWWADRGDAGCAVLNGRFV